MSETNDTNQNAADSSDAVEAKDSSPSEQAEAEMTFANFLESSPPSRIVDVLDVVISIIHTNRLPKLRPPAIQLFCEDNKCNGLRTFRTNHGPMNINYENFTSFFIEYKCSNCRKAKKTYSLAVKAKGVNKNSGRAYKYGELPTFGPRTPSRLVSLIGPEKDIFFRGRRCESQGLGIGAFAYYRRVVENQKNRILDEIIKVAEKLSENLDTLNLLKNAKQEQQFSKAIESIKDALPQALLLNGQNPLTLLHSALSEGLHAREDEHCLELAQDIRVVLAALADNISQALKDEEELNLAIKRLNQKK